MLESGQALGPAEQLAEFSVQMDRASSPELEQCLRQLNREKALSLARFARHIRDFLKQTFADLISDETLQEILRQADLLGLGVLPWQSWKNWQVQLLLCSRSRIACWNREFRGQDEATDILSFPAVTSDAGDAGPRGGDLLLAVGCWLDNCCNFRCTPEEELQRLLIHGLLHLMGLDHEPHECIPDSYHSPMLQYQETRLRQSLQRRAILPQ